MHDDDESINGACWSPQYSRTGRTYVPDPKRIDPDAIGLVGITSIFRPAAETQKLCATSDDWSVMTSASVCGIADGTWISLAVRIPSFG